MEVFVVLSTVLVLAVTAPSVSSFDIPLPFRKAMADCVVSNDTMTCLSVKGITAFNRFANSTKIEIFPGISIRRYGYSFMYNSFRFNLINYNVYVNYCG